MQASIVVPLLVFCKHAINMHDGRCCGVVLRIFRSIVPEFHKSQLAEDFTIPDDTATEIREYISSEVLQAAIQSLHDPYFVDSQKELGVVIASILAHYSATTQTPRSVLLSLPNMKAQEVDLAIELVSRPGIAPRQQRAIVLDLLKDLKGVSVSELGKLGKAIAAKPERATRRGARSKMTQDFMSTSNKADGEGDGAPAAVRKSPDLEGVAGMFGES